LRDAPMSLEPFTDFVGQAPALPLKPDFTRDIVYRLAPQGDSVANSIPKPFGNDRVL